MVAALNQSMVRIPSLKTELRKNTERVRRISSGIPADRNDKICGFPPPVRGDSAQQVASRDRGMYPGHPGHNRYTRSGPIAGGQNGNPGAAVPAGDVPGAFKMVTGHLAHDNTLDDADRAGVPDHVSGPGAPDFEMGFYGFHYLLYLMRSSVPAAHCGRNNRMGQKSLAGAGQRGKVSYP